MKEFADDYFKFDENGRKLSKWVENTVGKGEIARNKQFLLFPQCFQKVCFPGASKGVIVWKWVTDDKILDSSKLKEFADDNFKFDENGRKLSKWVENTVGKGEIARNEQFLLFPQCFQKACFPGASKGVTVWEWVKRHPTTVGLKDRLPQKLQSKSSFSEEIVQICSFINKPK